MQRAFNRWKKGSGQLTEELWRLPLTTVLKLGLKTTEELKEVTEQLEENNEITNHLKMQRDEFLNYYIKGQYLAMALVRDNVKFAEMQAVSRWLWARRQYDRINLERDIRDAAYLYANLQDKEKNLNVENKKLEEQNKDLGVFTKDGEIVKANMQRLKEETDSIRS